MNLLNLEKITKAYHNQNMLDQIDFSLAEGEKVGVIGINGTGKSTLLKMIAGLVEPDEGKVTMANRVHIRYLPQNPVFEENTTVLECILKDNRTEENQWSIEAEAKTMCAELGIADWNEPIQNLSGGQRKRVALAAVLLAPAEILILAEPTNHLDSTMSEWLENFLKKKKSALIMVTHDRYFLDSVCNRIVEIDHAKLYSYQTNYSGFLQAKQERLSSEKASERKRQSILRVEIQWMQRGARARSTKQKAHIQRYEALRDQKAPQEDSSVIMSSASTRMGRSTIELSHLSKSFGDKKVLDDFSYTFLRRDRIGFVGENGSGKTTLMKMIMGEVQPDCGTIEIGQTIKIGYYAQEICEEDRDTIAYMDPDMRVIDYIRNTAEYVNTPDGPLTASQMLENFLFPGEKQYALIGKLSGGEKRRLNLLRVLMEAPNVLILDEPTNDLDIRTMTILEDYLDHFDGIVITVSHDRYFLDRIVERIFAFEGNGKIVQYEGGFTDYQAKLIEREMSEQTTSKDSKADKGVKKKETNKDWKQERKRKFSYQEQKDWETIEDTIADLESQLESIEDEMSKCATDFVQLNELAQKKTEVENSLEERMERWMFLTELKAEIDGEV